MGGSKREREGEEREWRKEGVKKGKKGRGRRVDKCMAKGEETCMD